MNLPVSLNWLEQRTDKSETRVLPWHSTLLPVLCLCRDPAPIRGSQTWRIRQEVRIEILAKTTRWRQAWSYVRGGVDYPPLSLPLLCVCGCTPAVFREGRLPTPPLVASAGVTTHKQEPFGNHHSVTQLFNIKFANGIDLACSVLCHLSEHGCH